MRFMLRFLAGRRSSRRSSHSPALLLFAVILLTAVLACGEPAPPPTPELQAVIDDARARIISTRVATQSRDSAPDGAAASIRTPQPVASSGAAPPSAAPAPSTETASTGTTPTPAPVSRTPAPARSADVPAPTPALAPPPTPRPAIPGAPATPTASPSPSMLLMFRDLRNGPYLEQQAPAAAARIKALPWLADGINDSERVAAEDLITLAASYPNVAGNLLGYSWVADGLLDTELAAVEHLHAIAQQDAPSARRISAMPFLPSLEPADATALMALRQLVFLSPATLRRILDHPTLAGGITDGWAKVVAVLGGVSKVNPALVNTLLDPSRAVIEERSIELPHAGRVDLAIISTGAGVPRSMDLLEHSVRQAESFMDVPFPTNYVVVLFENAVAASSVGTNFGTHIAILPEFDADDGSQEAESAGHVIAHEVAHYYWSGNADWIDEGASDFLASIAELARIGRTVGVTNTPCAAARSIQTLEGLAAQRDSGAFSCNYSLGERLFVDLYQRLGEPAFRRGLRTLYLLSTADDHADDMPGTAVGIDQLTSSFVSPSDTPAARSVVDRWYNGTEPYDTGARDTRPVDSTIPDVNGQITTAYVSIGERGSPITQFSAAAVNDVVWLNVEYTHQMDSGLRTIELTIAEFYEDGFEYSRRNSDITARAGYSGGTQWFSIGPMPPRRWAPGRYWLYVYESGRKIAEVELAVTP